MAFDLIDIKLGISMPLRGIFCAFVLYRPVESVKIAAFDITALLFIPRAARLGVENYRQETIA